jgi:hypothetical protein
MDRNQAGWGSALQAASSVTTTSATSPPPTDTHDTHDICNTHSSRNIHDTVGTRSTLGASAWSSSMMKSAQYVHVVSMRFVVRFMDGDQAGWDTALQAAASVAMTPATSTVSTTSAVPATSLPPPTYAAPLAASTWSSLMMKSAQHVHVVTMRLRCALWTGIRRVGAQPCRPPPLSP